MTRYLFLICVVILSAAVYFAQSRKEIVGESSPEVRAIAPLQIRLSRVESQPPVSAKEPESPPVNALVQPDLDELDLALTSADQSGRNRALKELLPALVEQNPVAAARFADLYADSFMREQLLRRVAQLWTAQDAASAVAWAESLPESSDRDALLIVVSTQLGLQDPAQAVALRERHASVTEPDSALENLTQQWATKDFSAALAWATARPAGEQRDRLLEHIAFNP